MKKTKIFAAFLAALLLAFVLVLAAIPPALWLGSHIPTGPEAPPAALTAEQETVRDRLISLGLPEEVAAALDGAELDCCAGALRVEGARPLDLAYSEDALDRVRLDGPDVICAGEGDYIRLRNMEEKQVFEIVHIADVLGADALGVHARAVDGDVIVFVFHRPAQALGLKGVKFIAADGFHLRVEHIVLSGCGQAQHPLR